MNCESGKLKHKRDQHVCSQLMDALQMRGFASIDAKLIVLLSHLKLGPMEYWE